MKFLLIQELKEKQEAEVKGNVKRNWTSEPSLDPKKSSWWVKFILNTNWVKRHRGRKWRSRFRMPYDCFQWFVQEAKTNDYFQGVGDHIPHKVIAGKQRKLFILSSLAYMSGGMQSEQIEDACCISATANRAFFAKFVLFLAGPDSQKWLSSTSSDFEESAAMFSAAGLEGCFCACDGVKIRLWSCTYNLKNLHKGKEGYSTVGFNVACLSSGKIVCSPSFAGTHPDTTLAKNHSFTLALKNLTWTPAAISRNINLIYCIPFLSSIICSTSFLYASANLFVRAVGS